MKYKSKKEFLDSVVDNYSDQKEFHQAVEEVEHYMRSHDKDVWTEETSVGRKVSKALSLL